jgi:hypothetical protein
MTESHDSELVTVRVKPSSKKGSLVQPGLDGDLLVYTNQPAVDGKANKAIIELLAKYYDLPKTNIEIVRGHTGRIKIVKVMK